MMQVLILRLNVVASLVSGRRNTKIWQKLSVMLVFLLLFELQSLFTYEATLDHGSESALSTDVYRPDVFRIGLR